jgi:hypothetical protein
MLADPAVRNPLAWLGLGEFAAANALWWLAVSASLCAAGWVRAE